LAAENGHLGAVIALISAKASLSPRGLTPLYCAAEKGQNSIVQVLIDADASVDFHAGGRTPLHTAAARGYEDMLIDAKAPLSRIASEGEWLETASTPPASAKRIRMFHTIKATILWNVWATFQ